MSEAFQKPSSMTSFTLSLKIDCGVSSADGTSFFRTVSVTLPEAMLAASSPLISAMASLAAASASFLIAL